MEAIRQYIPFLIPVVLIELGLMVFALVDLIKRERTRGPRWMWFIIVIVFQIVGPVIYLLAGKDES